MTDLLKVTSIVMAEIYGVIVVALIFTRATGKR